MDKRNHPEVWQLHSAMELSHDGDRNQNLTAALMNGSNRQFLTFLSSTDISEETADWRSQGMKNEKGGNDGQGMKNRWTRMDSKKD